MTPPQTRLALLAGLLYLFYLCAVVIASPAPAPAPYSVRQADVVINKQTPPPLPSTSPFPTQLPSRAPPPAPTPAQPQPQPQPPSSTGQPSVSPVPPSPIPPVGIAGDTDPVPSPEPVPTRGLTTGGIVAIVLGALALLAFLVLLLLFVCRRSNTIRENEDTELGPGAAGYATARGVGGAGAAGGAGGYPTPDAVPATASDLPPQEVELAEAEAETGYVVSDTARHHGGVPAAAVAATAAGAGAAGVVAAVPAATDEPESAPSPAPHDYVVGIGQVKDKEEFEDIQIKFANDEIKDSTAVLGASAAIEAPLDEDKAAEEGANPIEDSLEVIPPVAASPAAAVVPAPETEVGDAVGDTKAAEVVPSAVETPGEVVENVAKADEIATGAAVVDAPSFDTSGDVSEAARGLGVTEIIAEEAAVTPALEKDALPLADNTTGTATAAASGSPGAPNDNHF